MDYWHTHSETNRFRDKYKDYTITSFTMTLQDTSDQVLGEATTGLIEPFKVNEWFYTVPIVQQIYIFLTLWTLLMSKTQKAIFNRFLS